MKPSQIGLMLELKLAKAGDVSNNFEIFSKKKIYFKFAIA
jgi:hypothetical protein